MRQRLNEGFVGHDPVFSFPLMSRGNLSFRTEAWILQGSLAPLHSRDLPRGMMARPFQMA